MVLAPPSATLPSLRCWPLPFLSQASSHNATSTSFSRCLFLRQLPVSQAFFMASAFCLKRSPSFLLPMGLKQPLPRSLGTRLCRGPIHNGLNAEAATFQVLSSAVCFPCSSPPGCTLSPSSLRLPKDFNGLAPQDSLQKTLPKWRPLPLFSSMLVSSFNLAWANTLRRDSHTQVNPLPPAVLVSLPGSCILLILLFSCATWHMGS